MTEAIPSVRVPETSIFSPNAAETRDATSSEYVVGVYLALEGQKPVKWADQGTNYAYAVSSSR
jgi:hypothetical protein